MGVFKVVNKRKFYTNIIIALLGLVISCVIYYCKNVKIESDYYTPTILATHDSGEHFVGSVSCRECHADVYESHIETAHFKTSGIADSQNIKGSFKEGENTLDLNDVTFNMLSKGDSFFQHTKIKNRSIEILPSKFDIVIGSGIRGQTYLSWRNDELFQLQASYYTPTNSWVNSPGFPSYSVERPIRDACLKCHLTYAKNSENTPKGNRFDRGQMIYGIDCERCHGPSAKHVAYQRENPKALEGKFVVKMDTLLRQQRLDLCAQCHSGLRGVLLKGNAFSYLPGDDLSKHSQNLDNGNLNEKLDVHGNQYGLLVKSKCFKETDVMDCNTCHNPHKKERGNVNDFNLKCIGCHDGKTTTCKVDKTEADHTGNNCVKCHMPTTPSTVMMVQLTKDSLETSFNIRTHLIDIYAKELWR